ncbi:MAG: M23 family metallopeptidase [bacterium]|nr:M23 family metallopeptidase [bacterium]
MKKSYLFIFLTLIIIAVFFAVKNHSKDEISAVSQNNPPIVQENISQDQNANDTQNQNNIAPSGFQVPLDRASQRVTRKPFGIYITPATSPVQPEKFQGYHTGTDFEIFSEELNADVPARAVCSGKLLLKKYASGYGGVAVEFCELDKNPITVVYGHLKLSSISTDIGENINAGDIIGILGANKSVETNGERKHLHLGFHKGNAVNILGYVGKQSDLSNWLNPCLYVCAGK